MDEWYEDAVQKWVFAGQGAAGCSGFWAVENSGAHLYGRASRPTEECRWSNRNIGVVTNALHFPSRIPCTNKRARSINYNAHRCAHRRAVAAIGRQRNRPLIDKRCKNGCLG